MRNLIRRLMWRWLSCLDAMGMQAAAMRMLSAWLRRAPADTGVAKELLLRENAAVTGRAPLGIFHAATMDPERSRRGEAYVHRLHNVLVDTEFDAVFDGDKVYAYEISGRNLFNHPWVSGRSHPEAGVYGVVLPAPSLKLEVPIVLLGTDGAINYSHWLSRIVLKLAVLEKAGIPASFPLLINENLARYQHEFLSLLHIPEERLLRLPKGIAVQCREILVPISVRNHPQMRDAIAWLRTRLASHIAPPEEANERLFVSRRDSPVRVLLNESEIESALADLGFKTVVLGELSVAEQIRCFSRAGVIVGAHGAGLSNLVFAPAHARVVEITNTRVRHMQDFRIIAAQTGMRYTEVVSAWYAEPRVDAPSQNPQHRDYFANVGDVVAAILEIAPELSG